LESPAQIIIVGAGLAGACAAALLARRGGLPAEHVVLLGDAAVAAPESGAPPQVRVVAVSRASERILSAAGAWTHLPRARLAPYEKMCVWHESGTPEGSGALWFDAAELGEPDLGHIVEHDLLLWACLASFRAAGGRLLPGRVAQLTLSAAEARLSLEDGAVLSAQLVVGADGARSAIREQLGLAVQRRD
jgi:2-octaprenylphenol hydroxylase